MVTKPAERTPTKAGTPPPAPGAQKLTPRLSKNVKSMEVKPGRVLKEITSVVIDLGTGYCKAGYAGQPRPSVVLSSVVGRPVQMSAKTGDNRQENFVGEELTTSVPKLKVVNPVKRGIVVDWDGVEAIWAYIFHKAMKIPPEDHAVMVVDTPLSPATNREKMAEILFETFSIPAMHVAYQSVLSLYSYGRTTGLVVECGHGVTHAVPVHEGYNMPYETRRAEYGGADLNDYLLRLLNEAGTRFTEKELHIVEDIKKKCCRTAVNFEEELNQEANENVLEYELPDGHVITVGKERSRCPEALFNPSIMGSKEPGIHALAMHSLDMCDSKLQCDMYSNIFLCGGSTMFEGFADRLQKEMSKMEKGVNPTVHRHPDRKYSVWLGGSIMSSLKSFQQLWVRKREYEERGPFAIYRKCF
ncbi:actin-like protein 7B [Hemitrygon akajei]|uniref:actin-like protein 7B n=1 Tax=Hemitrygon akajei TaxID=2704970 RepID=UPI003BF9A1A9